MTATPPRIAFVAPLSTAEAVVAGPLLQAVRRGAGRDAEVVACDDRRDPGVAADLLRALAADPRTIGVVGPKNSGSVLAALPIASAAHLPLLLPCATADELTGPDGVAFRLCAPDAAVARAAAAVSHGLGARRLAVLADDTAYGRGLARAVSTATAALGLEVTDSLEDADAVFHAMGEVEQADAMRAARAGGYAGHFLGAEGGPGAPLAQLAGAAGEGSLQLYPGAAVEGADGVYTAEAEDAAAVLLRAWGSGGGRAGTLAALRDLHWDGHSGPLAFDRQGEREQATVSVWRLHGGRAEAVTPA